MSYKLIVASAHHVPEIADKSVHLICCSPPYFGLRSYQGNQSIEWPTVSYAPIAGMPEITIKGCDADCAHVWVDGRIMAVGNAPSAKSTLMTNNGKGPQPGDKYQYGQAKTATQGAYCIHCGGWRGGLGSEPDIESFIGHLMLVLREMWRVLRDDGVLFWNISDSYSGSGGAHTFDHASPGLSKSAHRDGAQRSQAGKLRPKNLMGVPQRFFLAAQAEGWIMRQDIIWNKPNPMPESVTDRPTRAHEYIFMMTKSPTYYFDSVAIAERVANSSVSSVVDRSAFGNNSVEFVQNFGLEESSVEFPLPPSSLSHDGDIFSVCVRLATSILDFSHLHRQFGLSLLDTQVGKQSDNGNDSGLISDHPMIKDASVLASRFIAANLSPEAFLQHLHSLNITLPDSNEFGEGGRPISVFDPPSANGDTNTAVRVNDASQVSQFEFFDNTHNQYPPNEVLYPTSSTSSKRSKRDSFKREGSKREQVIPGQSVGTHRPDRKESEWDTATRNRRSVWTIATRGYPGNHFAAYPPEIPETCILAGTSAYGVCAKCGAPYRRCVEHMTGDAEAHARPKRTAGMNSSTSTLSLSGNGSKEWVERGGKTTTTGWEPTCKCGCDDVVPAIVADFFSGSGTTGMVCQWLGRDYVGIDLSDEYHALAHERINTPRERVENKRAPADGQIGLFEELAL